VIESGFLTPTGATQTVPLLPGSAAIDAANGTTCPATDQRGVTRSQGIGCDMGAFEAQSFSLSLTGGDGQSTLLNHTFADPLKVTVTGTGSDPVVGGKVTFTAPATGASATFGANPATIGSDGTASVTATANSTGGDYTVSAAAAGAAAPVDFGLTNIAKSAPTFTFDLSGLPVETYGDASFSVAGYATKPGDDTGTITFETGTGSVGCTVTSAGQVTIAGVATGTSTCIIEASLAADGSYLAAGPISQSFNIARAQLTVTADNQSMPYGSTLPNPTASYSGFVYAQTLATSGVTGSPGCSIAAGPYTVPGSPYVISCTQGTLSAANYSFALVNGTLTVTLTTPSFTNVVIGSTIYDGKPHGASATVVGVGSPAENLGSAAVSYELRSGTDPNYTYGPSTTTAPINAGVYRITFSYAGSANYGRISDNSHILTIATATLTITPTSGQSMVFGSTPPANLAYALSGFVNGETDGALRAAGALKGGASCSAGVSNTSGVNTYTISCTTGTLSATNYRFTVSTQTVTFAVTPATLTVTADNKSVQYSDPLPALTSTISGFVNGETPETSGVSGAPSLSTTGVTVNGSNVMSGPGTYTISVAKGTLAADNYIFTFVKGTLTVTQEDARAYYTGDSLFWGTSASASSATVTLMATIKDITAVTGDAAYDKYPGDVSHALVTFVNRDASSAQIPGCINLSVALVSSSDTKVGTVTCTTTLAISNSGATQFTIGIMVAGYYRDNASSENTVIDVAAPLTSYFITGGGFMAESASAGQYAADQGTKSNFGFNVKFNKGATNLQGNLNIIFRKGGHTYQIKSNALTSLGEKPSPCSKATATSPCTANFVSKANLQDITNPSSPVSLGGNLTFQMSMTDYGSPTKDTIGFTLYDATSKLLFSSSWSGTKTVEQLLGGGNLSVR